MKSLIENLLHAINFIAVALALMLFSCAESQESEDEPLTDGINVPDGFEVAKIYSPSDHEQGSWVCLTKDDRGRLIASDQYGALYRVTLMEDQDTLLVEEIPVNFGQAQGLLWAFNSLYVSVNTFDQDNYPSGIYRIHDTDGDDVLDQVEPLVQLDGAGEHGPHSLILGPDGQHIYLIAGNHTDIPEEFTSFQPEIWREDRIMPAIKDPRGHANDRGAPGGWIARSDATGKEWEVIANGFRNAYDIDFDLNGELFTYDSDMEWDLGTPWYRPTRICHVIPGSEFGWRTGSAKWPEYYTDNLPGVIPMGQGSPTGIIFGTHSNFPEPYRSGLFVLDWSFGTIYLVQFTPEGSSYSAEKEEFLTGNSLPLTDVVFGDDGAMYFTTGGRRSSSGLYRVRHLEPVNGGPETQSTNKLFTARRYLSHNPQELSTDTILHYLKHQDRYIRYAARIALENHSPESWLSAIGEQSHQDAIIQATIALARTGQHNQRQTAMKWLSQLDLSTLDSRQELDLVRAYGLLFSRLGLPSSVSNLNIPEYPSGEAALDRELCSLLSYINDPKVVEKTIPLMESDTSTLETQLTSKETLERSDQYGPVIAAMHENRPFEQNMSYAASLTQATKGWTPQLRVRYFKWFYESLAKSGGESYRGFLEKIRTLALGKVPPQDREKLAELSGEVLLSQSNVRSEQVPPPKGPGRIWEVGEANSLISDALQNRSFEHGKQMYQALLCDRCHTMQGEGGTVGPDLTQVSTRFSTWDVLQSIQTPSLAISDQYAATLYTLKDGSTIIGRTLSSDGDTVLVNVNPYQPNTTKALAKEQIEKEQISPVSLMPGGLINQLNPDELIDLIAYLKAGGNPDDPVFE